MYNNLCNKENIYNDNIDFIRNGVYTMRLFAIVISLLASLMIHAAYALDVKPSVMNINQYYDARCQSYTGTWQGFMTDPSNLYGDGGPWPVTVSLYNRNDRMIGETSRIQYTHNGGVIEPRQIWARCKNGVLDDIYWGSKDGCGDFSHQGLLVSKNVLILQLNHQSNMNEANFYLFLTRRNASYPHKIPEKYADLLPGDIKSCH